MKSVFHRTLLIAGALLLFQGCGESPVDTQSRQGASSRKAPAEIQSQLAKAEEELATLRDENRRLEEKLKSLSSTKENKGEEGKIELLGAKALAQFQLEQLNRRLDKLKTDLDAKDNELESIRQTAEQRANQIQELTRSIEQLQGEEKKRTTDLTSRLDKMNQELAQRSTESTQLKKNVEERDQLLTALKNAITDATKLKSKAEAETNRLHVELEQVIKKLELAKAAADQDRQAIGQLQAQEQEAREQVVKYSQAADQCKLVSDGLEHEINKLRTQLADLSSRLGTRTAEQNQTSIIDKILE